MKNVVVVIAPAAAGAMTRPGVIGSLCGATIAFCLVSSATYLVNDVRDCEADRRHPRKRHRPIASGELSARTALHAASVLAACGLLLALLVTPALAIVVLCYAALTSGYSLWWRNVPIVDMLTVAGGFVLRAAAGAAAAGVSLSGSFLLVTSACALFLIVGKRYAEVLGRGVQSATRPTLRRYSPGVLRLLLAGTAAVGWIAYARWSLGRPEIAPWLALSLIPFSLWLGCYAARLSRGLGEAPEELVLRDPALLGLSLLWALLLVVGIYGAR